MTAVRLTRTVAYALRALNVAPLRSTRVDHKGTQERPEPFQAGGDLGGRPYSDRASFRTTIGEPLVGVVIRRRIGDGS